VNQLCERECNKHEINKRKVVEISDVTVFFNLSGEQGILYNSKMVGSKSASMDTIGELNAKKAAIMRGKQRSGGYWL
jgi:hypothetical protein